MLESLRELLRYRELMESLVIRDLKVRYKSSVLGFLWSLLHPLLLMAVFTVVFTIMLPNFHIPNFPVFVMCALLPWNFFSTSLMDAVSSITGNSSLVTKVYFPREILTISSIPANFCNLLLSLPVLFLLIIAFRMPITIWIIYIPVVLLTQLLFTLGVSLVLATLNVYYRDTAVIMDVVMQAWFFVTPVFYPIDLLPQTVQFANLAIPVRRITYIMNPMASIIATYRSVLYGFTDGAPPTAPAPDFLLRTIVTSALCFVIGYAIFRRHSSRFAETI